MQAKSEVAAAELSRDEIAENVRRLFSPAADARAWENEERLNAVIQNFLRTTKINTPVTLDELAASFTSSVIPDGPGEVGEYLDYLVERVVAHSTHTSSPRFIGHMTSALPYFVRPLSKLLVAMNQNVVKVETAKALSPYERQAVAMLHRFVYDRPADFYEQHVQESESTLGMLVSGGTLANISALWCARNSSLRAKGEFAGVAVDGLPAALEAYGCRGAAVIGSSLMHYSIDKAADLLGTGTRGLIKVPTDGRGRIELSALREAMSDCRERRRHIIAIVGVAGTTESGAIDPLERMADIAQDAGVHFHVDAAWGGPLLFSRRHRRKLAGIERADSVTIDGHKQLYLPMGTGVALMRDPHATAAIEKHARYIVRAGSSDLGRRSLEGSRPGMALFLHAALNIIGARGYEMLIDESLRKTLYMADAVRARPEFQLLQEPEMNILSYRYVPGPWRERAERGRLSDEDNRAINRFNEELQKAQRQSGYSFVSRTTLDYTPQGGGLPVTVLRAVIANPLTTEEDIDSVLDDQLMIAANLPAEVGG
ncbi:MAG TPA: putative pyridoxal-dependent aspartate 1-decarboxylase [Pyrinomonadaceae bacterium]|nr:putative pyridoxal-dependent aspartate 1-decarboxylase [Pyrinomonadaceae bacterium]